MYGMVGKLTAQAGQGEQLAGILLRAAQLVGQFPGCKMYLVSRALDDPQAIWVMELWDDQAAHDASLADERVRALITEARPLLGAAPDGAALELLGGYGS